MSALSILVVVLAAAALLAVSWSFALENARDNSPARLVQPAFTRIFGSLSPMPRLQVSSAYGYPTFDLAFASKAEMEAAQPRITEFKRELNTIFRGYGSRERRFDAEMAMSATYPGYLEELAGKFRQSEGPQEESRFGGNSASA